MSLSVETYDQAAAAAQALGQGGARYLAGGTLVMRAVNYGDHGFARIVRAADPTLRQIRMAGDRIEIGASVTMSQVVGARELDFLAPVARLIGGPAVRSAATVGGNLFAPHPYGDFAVALLALDGVATTTDGQSTPLAELLARRDQFRGLVASVAVSRPAAGEFRFRKLSRVKPKGVSVMSMAAWLPGASGGRVSNARIAYGAMAPTPIRVAAVERALDGATLDEGGITPALAVALDGLRPPTDPLASEWYRREVAPVHLRRLLLDLER